MKSYVFEIKKGAFKIHTLVQELGEDLLVSIWGGTRPHIGAIGIAVPRPSLRDSKKWSATSSNFTFTGHKEDILVKKISERLATLLRRNVVVTAGIHWDNLSPREIKMLEKMVEEIPKKILKKIAPIPRSNIKEAGGKSE